MVFPNLLNDWQDKQNQGKDLPLLISNKDSAVFKS